MELYVELEERSECNNNYCINGMSSTKEEALFHFNHVASVGILGKVSYAGETFIVVNIQEGFYHNSFSAIREAEYLESIKLRKD